MTAWAEHRGVPISAEHVALPTQRRVVLRGELEKQLAAHHGNLRRVAQEMGKARQPVQRWVKRLGLKS